MQVEVVMLPAEKWPHKTRREAPKTSWSQVLFRVGLFRPLHGILDVDWRNRFFWLGLFWPRSLSPACRPVTSSKVCRRGAENKSASARSVGRSTQCLPDKQTDRQTDRHLLTTGPEPTQSFESKTYQDKYIEETRTKYSAGT